VTVKKVMATEMLILRSCSVFTVVLRAPDSLGVHRQNSCLTTRYRVGFLLKCLTRTCRTRVFQAHSAHCYLLLRRRQRDLPLAVQGPGGPKAGERFSRAANYCRRPVRVLQYDPTSYSATVPPREERVGFSTCRACQISMYA